MASDMAVLNLGEIGEAGLEFTSTTTHTYDSSRGQENQKTYEFNDPSNKLNYVDDDVEDDDRAGLLGGDTRSGTGVMGSYNFLSLNFYSRFFDVDTEDVCHRLVWSVWPRLSATPEFLQRSIRPKPDLYGPFWVCVTLVFSVAISGNVANYLQTALRDGLHYRWHYDFHKVSLAATAVFGYACTVPALVYGTLWWTGTTTSDTSIPKTRTSFLELLCVYGYSLAVFVPVSILWTIQVSWLQWCLVVLGAGLSGSVLVLAIRPSVEDRTKKARFFLLLVVIVLHLALAGGFMLYFFHAAPPVVQTKIATNPVAATVENADAAAGEGGPKEAVADKEPKVSVDESVPPGDPDPVVANIPHPHAVFHSESAEQKEKGPKRESSNDVDGDN